jgi:predicted nucleic-acid-binding protein
VRITADTNLLVRIVVRDDAAQAWKAYGLVSAAERVAIPLPSLCEVAWVLESVYGFSASEISLAIRAITEPGNSVVDSTAVEAGLRLLDGGGDFADGVIAAAGSAMGGEIFVSFDRKAVARINAIGMSARNAGDL